MSERGTERTGNTAVQGGKENCREDYEILNSHT